MNPGSRPQNEWQASDGFISEMGIGFVSEG